MKTTGLKQLIPGVALCAGLAAAAWAAGSRLTIVGAAVIGILSGILIAAFVGGLPRHEAFAGGIRFTGKKLLQWAIILLGFEMDLGRIATTGRATLILIVLTLVATGLAALLGGRLLRVDRNSGTLIAVGTAICGGSAIAAAAPAIGAKDEEVARSISTIFLFNVAAVFLFPALGRSLGLSDYGFGVWAGTAVNDTSSVVAAASAWGQRAGNDTALTVATVVKLTRTLFILPVTFALSLYTARRQRSQRGADFSLGRIFPWFVLWFLVAAAANSFLPLPAGFSSGATATGKFVIVMAMVAIGLSTDPAKIRQGGWRPVVLGLICWASVAAASLAVQGLTGGV